MIDRPGLKSVLLIGALALSTVGCGSNSKFVENAHANGDDAGSSTSSNNGTSDTGGPLDAGVADTGVDTATQVPPIGFMTGSWRVGNADDQSLISDFDLNQPVGSTSVTGKYTMGSALGADVEGKSGDIAGGSSFDGTTLTLKWNPTDSSTELYTISAEKQEDGTLSGQVTAAEDPQVSQRVVITRYQHPAGDDPVLADAGM